MSKVMLRTSAQGPKDIQGPRHRSMRIGRLGVFFRPYLLGRLPCIHTEYGIGSEGVRSGGDPGQAA
jgi:hypothetical protein